MKESITIIEFVAFGGTPSNTSLFGTQQNANTSLFGTGATTSAFGQANKPTSFGFGATTGNSLFGQPQQTVQQTTPFGQASTTANTSLFGTGGGKFSLTFIYRVFWAMSRKIRKTENTFAIAVIFFPSYQFTGWEFSLEFNSLLKISFREFFTKSAMRVSNRNIEFFWSIPDI